MECDRLLFDDWHPIASLDDIIDRDFINTQLLGQNICVARHEREGVCAWKGRDSSPDLIVKEAYGALWVSMSPQPKALFDIPEFAEDDRRILSGGSLRVNVSGLRAVENFLDMAHFPFVHTDILGAEPMTDVAPYQVTINAQNEIVATECRFPQPKAAATANGAIETDYIYRVVRPYSAILYKTCPPDPQRWDVLCLFVQPTQEDECIVHTVMCYIDEVNSDEQLRRFQQTIFGQDLMILINQVPKCLPLSTTRENPVRADVMATTYRRWLRESGLWYGALLD